MNKIFKIFSVYGIELEYMIVNKDTLEILPITDQLIKKVSGTYDNEFSLGEIAISNELALHVVEFKTDGPKASLTNLDQLFHSSINLINNALADYKACLLPTGAHPWMIPHDKVALWPHGDRRVYQNYHRIFNCAGHGWMNLQSTHLNLPFADDHEFCLLHNAIRLLLPIIPALSASTPILEGKLSNYIDGRLYYYGKNQCLIPAISGLIIPEFIKSKAEYEEQILKPMYTAIASYDKDKILQYEWLNSRGAIARFDRNAIEIRIIDVQESPLADIAIVALIMEVLKFIIHHTSHYLTQPMATQDLKIIYDEVIEKGSRAFINNATYLLQFDYEATPVSVFTLWENLYERVKPNLSRQNQAVIEFILSYGNLSERILKFIANDTHMDCLKAVYNYLKNCLQENRLFDRNS